MRAGLWARWVALHGLPGLFLTARRRDPMCRVVSHSGHGDGIYSLLEEVRARGPLSRTAFTWVTADHKVCREILRDDRFHVTPPAMELPKPLRALLEKTDPEVPNPMEPPAMTKVDGAKHTLYRSRVARSFTPRAISELSTRIAEITTELLDRLAGTPNVDLIAGFANSLPITVITEMLGMSDDKRPLLLEYGHAGTPLLDVGISWATYRRAIEALEGADRVLRNHFHQLHEPGFCSSRSTPFTRLAADASLTKRELVANAALLLGAGFETASNSIGNGIVALLRHPDQLERLRDDPALWGNAVEEILRWDSPVQMTARTAACDAEIGGVKVSKGRMVVLFLGGANRDPKVFTYPERFDITRSNAREHVAFGSGVHACLGAALARIEAATALQALFDRFPGLRLTDGVQRRGLVNLRGYAHLPAELHDARKVA